MSRLVFICARQCPRKCLTCWGILFCSDISDSRSSRKWKNNPVLRALQKQIYRFHVILPAQILDVVYFSSGPQLGHCHLINSSVAMKNSRNSRVNEFQPPFHSLPPTFPSSLWYTNSRDVLASGPLHWLFPLSEMLSTNCSFSCVILLSLKCHLIIEAFPDSPV